MGFFNEIWKTAMESSKYICPKCGGKMEFEDEWEETLICPSCGYDEDIDHYGLTDEQYENLYPTKEQVLGTSEGNSGETYDEVYGELDQD